LTPLHRPPICLPDRQANKSYSWHSARQLKPARINKSKGGKVDLFNKKRIPSGMNKEPKFKAEELIQKEAIKKANCLHKIIWRG
jgi:hypothetical protein